MPLLLSEGQTASPLPYLSFFDPSCLRRLRLESQSMSDIDYFLADKLAITSFRRLHVFELKLDGSGTSMTCTRAYLLSLPLTICHRCQEGPVPSTPLAPQLRAYKGWMSVLPVLDLQSSAVQTLAFNGGNAGGLLRILQTRETTVYTSITSLTMGVLFKDLTTDPVLHDTLSFFPNLRVLTIMVSSDRPLSRRLFPEPPSSAELGDRLVTVLGAVPALETMGLDWWLEDNTWKEIIPSVEELEITLFPTLPSLRLAHIL
ncbi:hypothetical protein K438DRAFT_1976232 [Mycena galopus ATCC 62051]|nr:hypothetical protein K438DRAFT_1976232 [Mycena galopus ATCC 62051]